VAQVVLSRAEWGQTERLPPCCIYCGRVADGYVVKSLLHQSGGFEGTGPAPSGEAAAAGCFLGVLKWLTVGNDPARTTRLRLNLPVCARHRRAWLVWSWFRMSMDHESLTLSGVADEFARAVEGWRARIAGESPSRTNTPPEPDCGA
jgi:hypothetical protein